MNTQAERLVSHRSHHVFGLTYLRKIAAWVRLKRKAYRARRLESEALEALKAMSPELLDDIGVKIDEFGKPTPKTPYVTAAQVLTLPPRYHDPS